MPAAEIAAGITGIRATMNVLSALKNLRDQRLVQEKVDEIRLSLTDVISQLIDAQQAQMTQLEEVQSLKAEITQLREWKAEEQRYELKTVGHGGVAFMLKPSARGEEPPHWLCPTCFSNRKKSYFQFSTRMSGSRGSVYRCKGCDGHMTVEGEPRWL